MYLGAHSLNQVVQGMFLGLCMSFLYLHGGLRHQINDFLSNVLTKRKWWCTVLLLHSLYLLAFFFNANFDIHSPQAQAKWAKQILIKCNR